MADRSNCLFNFGVSHSFINGYGRYFSRRKHSFPNLYHNLAYVDLRCEFGGKSISAVNSARVMHVDIFQRRSNYKPCSQKKVFFWLCSIGPVLGLL